MGKIAFLTVQGGICHRKQTLKLVLPGICFKIWKIMVVFDKKKIGLSPCRLIMKQIVGMFIYWVWNTFTLSNLRMSWFYHKNQTGLSVPSCAFPGWKSSRKWTVNLNHCILAEIIITLRVRFHAGVCWCNL